MQLYCLIRPHEKRTSQACFSVASVEKFTKLLKKMNIAREDRDGNVIAIITRPDCVKQVWLTDPYGYLVEVNDAKE